MRVAIARSRRRRYAPTGTGPEMRPKLSSTRESNYSPRFQFEFLTLCVWVSDLLLVYVVGHPRHAHHFDGLYGYMIAIVHLIPWSFGLRQWKEAARQKSAEVIDNCALVIKEVILLALWSTYLPLIYIEFVFLLFHH
jgi:hypothetical protein